MKVGILTFHYAKNYGAVLQAFALQETLKKMGLNPIIINRYKGYNSIIQALYFNLRLKYILLALKWYSFNKFGKKHLIKTRKFTTNKSIENFERNEKLDAVVIGSDQVWRMEFSSIGYNYFLDFIKNKNIKKVSYAASFGKDKWLEDKIVTAKVKDLLNDFNYISVREKSGVKICNQIFNINATHVLDPTFLLNGNDYDSLLLKGYSIENKNTLVTYFLGVNHTIISYCNRFAQRNGLDHTDLYYIYPLKKIFASSTYGAKHYLHIAVPEWIAQIRNAKYVLTNSFHGTIFAIIFKKQFVVIDSPGGGTERLISLLESLELQDRFISDISKVSFDLLNAWINYDKVHSKLMVEKEHSISFLKKSLFFVI